MPTTAADLELLQAKGLDLERRARLLLGSAANADTVMGPAAKAAALAGYLAPLDAKVPTNYEQVLKSQQEADARQQKQAAAAAKAEADTAAKLQKLQDAAAERAWKAQQAALDRASRERAARATAAARPDPLEIEAGKAAIKESMAAKKLAREREEGYQATLREVQRARQIISQHGNDLFGPYQTSAFNQNLAKFAGTDAQKGRELYAQTMKQLELAAAEAMRGTGPITENERATLRGTVGADVSDQQQAMEILRRLEENARARRPLWGGAAPLEEADDVAEE